MYYKRPEDCSETDREYSHAMTVIGYGTTKRGADYWKVRNSFSKEWGKNGNILLARNTDWENGQNGILKSPLWIDPWIMGMDYDNYMPEYEKLFCKAWEALVEKYRQDGKVEVHKHLKRVLDTCH